MEDLAEDAADVLMEGIDFNDIQEMSEAELQALEEKNEKEREEIQSALTDISADIHKLKDDPSVEGLKLLSSLLKDDTLIVDAILGNMQGQPQNKVNLKFLLAKNHLLQDKFDYNMNDCTAFVLHHEPRDGSMYDHSELIHILKMFIVFLYRNKEQKQHEEKRKLDDDEEEIKT